MPAAGADGTAPSAARADAGAPYRDAEQLRALVAGFEATTLPYPEWTHAAHLSVGVCYLAWYGPDGALDRVRDGLRRYNAAHAHHPMRVGYHETITRFWLWVVQQHVRQMASGRPLAEVANGVIAACTDRNLPFTYYSRERLMSDDARHRWVEPDLRSLE
jgi:hypothetical protein